ncbi:uncharacterized protein KZ484_010345 [Pholidichthys leucotaenia]
MLGCFLFSNVLLLQVCCAPHINCIVKGNVYSVDEVKDKDCLYQWTNSSGVVVANQGDYMRGLVKERSITTLSLHECLETVHYTRDCLSEGVKKTAVCTADRIKAAHGASEGTGRHHWITGAVFALVALIL